MISWFREFCFSEGFGIHAMWIWMISSGEWIWRTYLGQKEIWVGHVPPVSMCQYQWAPVDDWMAIHNLWYGKRYMIPQWSYKSHSSTTWSSSTQSFYVNDRFVLSATQYHWKRIPKRDFLRKENVSTLNCSSVMQAKYVWSALRCKSDKNSLRGNISFPFAPTSALAGRSNKETIIGTVEKVQWMRFWGSCSFRRKEKYFLVMIIRGSIETLPIEVLEEVTTTLH